LHRAQAPAGCLGDLPDRVPGERARGTLGTGLPDGHKQALLSQWGNMLGAAVSQASRDCARGAWWPAGLGCLGSRRLVATARRLRLLRQQEGESRDARRSKMPSCASSQFGRVTKGLMALPTWSARYGRALWALSVLPVTLGCQPVTIAVYARSFYGVASRGRVQASTCGRGAAGECP
jgi:hypothetical protein